MVAGLVKRVTQFRYLGYAMLGIGFLAVESGQAQAWIWIVLASLAWPLALQLSHALPVRPRTLQAFENLAGPLCAAFLQFPAVQLMALLVSLLSGNIAQGGIRRLPEALLTVGVGWMAGDWARTRLDVNFELMSTGVSDLIGYAHILLFTSLLSAAGYERSLRMHRARSELRAESNTLRTFSRRIARYVDPRLSNRLRSGEAHATRHRRLWMGACFVDLVGFTHMTGRMAPEAVCEIVNLFLAHTSRLSASAGGRMDKFLGDGVLITFGDEEAPCDDSLSRTRLADAMLAFCASVPKAMVDLNQELCKRALHSSLEVRMGAASGYCTVGDFGEGDRLDYTVIGPAVNLASRLEALAPVGGLLIDEATQMLASECWPRSHRGARDIKGLPEAVDIWGVDLT